MMSIEMPEYQSFKRVKALEISKVAVGARCLIEFADKRFDPVSLPPEMFARYVPKPGDFFVQYEDGYTSFSPRKAFVEGYSLLKKPRGKDQSVPALLVVGIVLFIFAITTIALTLLMKSNGG